MAPIRGFIFDLDGVLVDTARYHFKAWRKLANSLGIDFSETENEQLKGVSRRNSLEKILNWGQKTVSESDFDRLMEQKNNWYLEFIEHMDSEEVLPGAREFLDRTQEAGLKIALGSASKNALLILEKTGLQKYFDVIIDGNSTDRSKPDPQVFLMGAEGLSIAPNEGVVFEDSISGLEAARRGGFHCVGIGNADSLGAEEYLVSGLHEVSPSDIITKLS